MSFAHDNSPKTGRTKSGWAAFYNAWNLDRRGQLGEAEVVYERALAAFCEPHHIDGYIRTARALGSLYNRTGRSERTLVLLEGALSKVDQSGEQLLQAEVLRTLADACRLTGDLSLAFQHLQGALALFEAHDQVQGFADVNQSLAKLYFGAEDPTAALEHFERARRGHEQLGDLNSLAHDFNGMGEVARLRGDIQAAEDHYRDALRLLEPFENVEDLAIIHANLGLVTFERGLLDEAKSFLTRAAEEFRALGLLPYAAAMFAVIAGIEADAGDADACSARLDDISALALTRAPADPDYHRALRLVMKFAKAVRRSEIHAHARRLLFEAHGEAVKNSHRQSGHQK